MLEEISNFGALLDFGVIKDVLEKKGEKVFTDNTYAHIARAGEYVENMINIFESMKPESRGYIFNIPSEVLRGTVDLYTNGRVKDAQDIDYINDNLENIVNQINDLKDNPFDYYSKERTDLYDFVRKIEPVIEEVQNRYYRHIEREMDCDD